MPGARRLDRRHQRHPAFLASKYGPTLNVGRVMVTHAGDGLRTGGGDQRLSVRAVPRSSLCRRALRRTERRMKGKDRRRKDGGGCRRAGTATVVKSERKGPDGEAPGAFAT